MKLRVTLLFLLISCEMSLAQIDAIKSNRVISDMISSIQLTTQNVGLNKLNQTLQQAGYGQLPTQLQVISMHQEAGNVAKRWRMMTDFGFSFPKESKQLTGTNRINAYLWQLGVNVGYQLMRRSSWNLMPHLGYEVMSYRMTVWTTSTPSPAVSTVLANPGSTQSATLKSGAIAGVLGFQGSYRFTYARQEADCIAREKSIVLGFDAGYRLAPNSSFNIRRDGDPTVQLSGWYAALRLGFGTRTEGPKLR